MGTIIEAIQNRRSIRKFQEREVSREIAEKIVAAAVYAPSWKNTQIARYTFLDDRGLIMEIAREGVCGFQFNADTLRNAPAVFVISMVTGRSGFERDGSYSTEKGDRWQMFDVGIAVQTLCLAAMEYGIGTVIMGIFDETKIAQIIKLPDGEQIAALVPCGFSDEKPLAPARKSPKEVLRFC